MPLRPDAINGRLQSGVEQFDDHDNHHRACKQRNLYPSLPHKKGQRNHHDTQVSLLLKGGLLHAGLETL